AVGIVGRQVLALAVFTTLARQLEPSAFGLVGLVGVYLGFIGLFIDYGIPTALIQRKNLQTEHLDAAFWFTLACSGLVCAGTYAFARSLSALLGDPELAALLQWSSLGLVFMALSQIPTTLCIKALDFRRPIIGGLIGSVIGGTIGIVMAF